MPASGRNTPTFLLDTNVFVAAVKHPRRETATLRFLLALLEREDTRLVGNPFWVEEMLRYAEEFHSETAAWLVGALLGRTRVVHVAPNFVTVPGLRASAPSRRSRPANTSMTMPAARNCPPAASTAAATLPMNPAAETMFGVTPIAASGETIGSVSLVETL